MAHLGHLLRVFAGEVHAALARLFAYFCVLGLLGLLAADFVARQSRPASAAPAPQPEWIDVGRPFPAFALALPEIGEARYAIQRHAAGGGRKDILTFEAPDRGPAASLEIYRPGTETADAEGETGVPELRLAVGAPRPATIATKFGAFAVAEFTDQHNAAPRQCLRFSRSFDDPLLVISGWYCNAGLEVVDRAIVACALDRLTLLAAGGDPKIGALFAHAELKRSFCGTRSVILAATPKRADWIDTAQDPHLRGRR